MKLKLLSLIFLFGAVETSAIVEVRCLRARGYHAVPQVQARRICDQFADKMTGEARVRTRLRRFTSIKSPFSRNLASIDQNDRLELLYSVKRAFNRMKNNYDINIAILPPIVDGGYDWIAGYAFQCRQYGHAYVTAMEKNVDGVYRIPQVTLAVAHEGSHVGGAKHRDYGETRAYPCNIMDPNAMAYMCTNYLEQTVGDIQRCAGRW